MDGPLSKDVATTIEMGFLIVELVVQRGARAVRTTIEGKDFSTGEDLHLPKLMNGNWWTTTISLDPQNKLDLSRTITARRHAIFYWRYDDDKAPTKIYCWTRAPPPLTITELDEEMARRYHHLQEVMVPAQSKRITQLQEDINRMRGVYERAPHLVPQEDGSAIVKIFPIPTEKGRMKEMQDKAKEDKEKLDKWLDEVKLPIMKPMFEFLQRLDVRLGVVEERERAAERQKADIKHLQDQMEAVFQKMNIKPLVRKKAAAKKKAAAEKKNLTAEEVEALVKEEEEEHKDWLKGTAAEGILKKPVKKKETFIDKKPSAEQASATIAAPAVSGDVPPVVDP